MTKYEFGLFEYDTENIGDEVQSIAARQFLPRVDRYVDRDNIDKISFTGPTKLITNGWFMHEPDNWPPRSAALKPLLISMYVDQKNPKVIKAFSSENSVEYLSKFGPVGARDKATADFFNKHGVESYFSGCVTLTLKRNPAYRRGEYVLAVDVSKEVEEELRRRTKLPVVTLSVYRTPNLSREEKYVLAEYYLYMYQSAHAVVTTRLHTMLPCLAFETPVALIKEDGKFEADRYYGLVDLVRSYTKREFLSHPSVFDINSPPKNKTDYIPIRESLTEACQEFTGHMAHMFSTVKFTALFRDPNFMQLLGAGSAASYRELLRIGDVAWSNELVRDARNQIAKLKDENSSLRQQNHDLNALANHRSEILEGIQNSISWRITQPVRSINRIRKVKDESQD